MKSMPFAVTCHTRGFSLVELMVSITIGMLILAGMVTLFSNNSRTQREIEKANLQIENGRFATQLMSGDIANAGFYAEFDPSVLTVPGSLPDPCSLDLSTIRSALPIHIQGVDNVTASAVSCISDVKPGTDVLVLRRVQTCAAGTGNCAATSAGGVFFQASLCSNSTQLDSTDTGDHYDLDSDTAQLTRRRRDCTEVANSGTLATIRRFVTHIYYVANNSSGSDGVPTLKRAELGGTSLAFTVVPLVEGVENLQLEYGIDSPATSDPDSSPDSYTPAPGTVANWTNVVAVKLNILARNLEPSTGHTDTKTYVLGLDASGNDNTVAASNDRYKRHVFQTTVHMPNPAGRKVQ